MVGKIRYGRAEAAGFRLTELGYSRGYRIPRHVHADPQLCFVLDGLLTEGLGRVVLQCRRFDVSFKPARAPHDVESGPEGARVLVVQIPRQRLETSPQLAKALSAPIHIPRGALDGLGLGLHSELHNADRFTRLVIEGGALELLANVSRRLCSNEGSEWHPWLQDVTRLITEHFAERVSIRGLARMIGVPPRRLARVFRQRYHCDVDGYLRRLRVDAAAKLLSVDDRALAEIALTCGFYDQSHFTRIFKQHIGVTPGAYRSTCLRARSSSSGDCFEVRGRSE